MGKAKPLSASVRPAQSFQHGGILSTALLLPLIFLPTVFVGLKKEASSVLCHPQK
jgi:hypothetical protein